MSTLSNSSTENNEHDECEVAILRKLWKNRIHPVPGLYCAIHGKLIKWLSLRDARFLIDEGVEDIGMLPEEEVIYHERLRKRVKKNIDARTIL